MLGVIITIVVVVIVYHWVDKSNFYKALIASKKTAVHSAIVAKEAAKTAKKGWDATKSAYIAEEKSHRMEYAKAGQDYEAAKFAEDRKAIASIKEAFAGVNKYLDDTKTQADLRSKECDEFLSSLHSTK